jgi:hypothetical protein
VRSSRKARSDVARSQTSLPFCTIDDNAFDEAAHRGDIDPSVLSTHPYALWSMFNPGAVVTMLQITDAGGG